MYQKMTVNHYDSSVNYFSLSHKTNFPKSLNEFQIKYQSNFIFFNEINKCLQNYNLRTIDKYPRATTKGRLSITLKKLYYLFVFTYLFFVLKLYFT